MRTYAKIAALAFPLVLAAHAASADCPSGCTVTPSSKPTVVELPLSPEEVTPVNALVSPEGEHLLIEAMQTAAANQGPEATASYVHMVEIAIRTLSQAHKNCIYTIAINKVYDSCAAHFPDSNPARLYTMAIQVAIQKAEQGQ